MEFKTNCPYCNYEADQHETLHGREVVKNGDISFCIECGEASEYMDKKLLRIDEEKLDQGLKKEFKEITHAWLKTRARESVGEKYGEKV